MTSRTWNAGASTGALRVLVGVALLRWRRLFATRLAGAPDDDRTITSLVGFFGARDLALGVATLAATRPEGDVPKMLRLQALADAVDAGLIVATHRAGRLSRTRTIAGASIAVASALGFLTMSLQVRGDTD